MWSNDKPDKSIFAEFAQLHDDFRALYLSVVGTHKYFVADNLPLKVGIDVQDGEAAAGVSEDQFGIWKAEEGRLRGSEWLSGEVIPSLLFAPTCMHNMEDHLEFWCDDGDIAHKLTAAS